MGFRVTFLAAGLERRLRTGSCGLPESNSLARRLTVHHHERLGNGPLKAGRFFGFIVGEGEEELPHQASRFLLPSSPEPVRCGRGRG